MTIEEIMDLQDAGSRARILGLDAGENPFSTERLPNAKSGELGDWMTRHDAWRFGWEAEDASRKGQISKYFRELVRDPRAAIGA